MTKAFYTQFIFSLFFFSFLSHAVAQAPDWLWAKSIGGTGDDVLASMTLDLEGNVITTGYFKGTVDFDPGDATFELTSNGGWDIFLLKMDPAGDLIWARTMGGSAEEYGLEVAVDAAGNIILAGSYSSSFDMDPGSDTLTFELKGLVDSYFSKFDPNGNLLWAKSITGTSVTFALAMVVDHHGSGGIYSTGRFNGETDFDPDTSASFNITANDFDIFILKLDDAGNLLWAKSMGASAFDVGYDLAVDVTGSGEVYATGSYRGVVDFDPDAVTEFNLTATGNQNMFLTKLDGLGNFVWAKTLEGPNNTYGSAITLDENHVYTTGLFNGPVDFDPGAGVFSLTANGYDPFILKLDLQGDLIWATAMGGGGFDIAYSIKVDKIGDIYTTGFYNATADFDPGKEVFNISSEGVAETFVSKLNSSGDFIWAQSIGGITNDYGIGVALDETNHLHVAGYFASPEISFDSVTLDNESNTGATTDFFIAKMDLSIPSATNNLPASTFNIYPNPVNTKLTIVNDSKEWASMGVTLYNTIGEVFYSTKQNEYFQEKTIDTKSLPPGLYFIEIHADNYKWITSIVKD